MSSNSMWGGRFQSAPAAIMEEINASIGFDKALWRQDIQGSKAHVAMLAKQGIVTEADAKAISQGLDQVAQEIEKGDFTFSRSLEDIHMNVESRLAKLIGAAAGRLHTARSRNDQVATDMRLYVRDTVDALDLQLADLQRALAEKALAHADAVMPGFTHLQSAQPVTFGHHLMAYVEMFSRDAERLQDCRKRVNRMPLGAAALAGTSYPIDRERVAKSLGFDGVCQNSLDAVSDRDFAIEFTASCSLIMMHVSRLSEELTLWMTPRVGFIELPDRFCTGSSIMPQKKNPDVPELARGKTGRVYGHLMGLLTLMKGQALAYNKDNQEDKEPLFDTADTVLDTLRVFADMVAGIQVNKSGMRAAAQEGYATATDLADYLVKKGLPFRDAHEAVALAVRAAVQSKKDLSELSLTELQSFSSLISDDVFEVLKVEGSVAARDHVGGTAPNQVRQQIRRYRSQP